MSHDATCWARKQQTGSTPAKFLLMMLADHAGSDYSCWPGQESLSKLTEMSERTIRRATELLVAQGLIRVFYRYRSDNTRRSCRYQLLIDGPGTELPETVDWRSMKQLEPDAAAGTPPDSLTSSTGQADQLHRSESPVIPSKEPAVEEPSGSNLAATAPKKTRATRIPENFQPDEKMRAWFAEEKLSACIDGRVEHERFCDYFAGAPGVKGQKVDWPATWRNWMRTAAERAPRRAGSSLVPISGASPQYRPSTTDQRIAQGNALAAKYREQGL